MTRGQRDLVEHQRAEFALRSNHALVPIVER